MTRIIVNEDCGNSPKNKFVENLTVAFAKGDTKFILGNVTDNICWNIVGDQLIQGKDHFARVLGGRDKVVELIIRHIATHGKAGAVDGVMKLQNGKTLAFCDMYEFSGAKGTAVREITSYVIPIQ